MQHKVVDPFLNNLVSVMLYQGTEILKLRSIERSPATNLRNYDLDHATIAYDQFRAAFPSLVFPMNVDWFMLIGVEKYNDAEVFIKLGHTPRFPAGVEPATFGSGGRSPPEIKSRSKRRKGQDFLRQTGFP